MSPHIPILTLSSKFVVLEVPKLKILAYVGVEVGIKVGEKLLGLGVGFGEGFSYPIPSYPCMGRTVAYLQLLQQEYEMLSAFHHTQSNNYFLN